MHTTNGCAVADRPRRSKVGQVCVSEIDPRLLKPAPENEALYRPISEDDPETAKLIESIHQHGIRNPIVATLDNFIVGGHRRRFAAIEAGLDEVPVRYLDFRREDDPDRFLRLLRDDNRQRDKSIDEMIREELVDLADEDVYERVAEYRKKKSRVALEPIQIEGVKKRAGFNRASMPFVELLIKIVKERRDYWPLSVRGIHYRLLEHLPITYVGRPKSRYANQRKWSAKLSDFLTRMRVKGMVSWDAIDDETRPVELWNVHQNPREYMRKWARRLFLDYYRDRMQSQPCHIEAVCEKLTVTPLVSAIFGEYTIPLETGRGYDAISKRRQLSQRFKKSGKERLVVLMLGDFDTEGKDICHAYARSMRDDFGIKSIHVINVALTKEQVKRFKLPPMMKVKEKSQSGSTLHRAKKFIEKHGKDVWELDALEPEQLQKIVREAIDSVIDIDLYNREVAAELNDQRELAARRQIVFKAIGIVDE